MVNAALNSYNSSVDTSDLTYHVKNKKGELATPSKSDSANEWFYKKQEAAMNQRYALESAAISNQYMIDQWNRENAYNDPSVVATRYRLAGINPRAAFGTGSASGAGLAAHSTAPTVNSSSTNGSYGKSDFSQGVENVSGIIGTFSDIAGDGVAVAKSIGGLTNLSANTTHTKAVTEGVQIENRYKEQQILTGLQKQRADISHTLADTDLKESEKAVYEKQLGFIDQQISESEQRIRESGQRIKESEQSVKESQAREKKTLSDAEQQGFANEFSKRYNKTPIELFTSIPGLYSVLASAAEKATTSVVDEGIKVLKGLSAGVLPNGEPVPDPVKSFVKGKWNKIVDYLNDLDEQYMKKNSTKKMKKFD